MEVKKNDERIRQDLKELYQSLTKQIVLKDIVENLEPIAAAQKLSEKLFDGDGKVDDAYALSCYGLPGYFTGKREAQTVMVMLNPGIDAMDNDNPFCTLRSLRNYGISLDSDTDKDFIRKCNEGYRDFGKHPSYKVDNFDLKQAVFLSGWNGTGVEIPDGFPDKLIKNRGKKISASVKKAVDKYWQEYVQHLKEDEIRDSESRAAAYKEIVGKIKNENELQEVREQLDILFLKEKATRNVLMQKLQLELIPYASRSLDTKKIKVEPLFEYLETILQEIFKVKRKYVIFCSRIFERLFVEYRDSNRSEFEIESLEEKKGAKMSCTLVRIKNKHSKKRIVALIANSFSSRALSNAYEKMQEYGEFCYTQWKKSEG